MFANCVFCGDEKQVPGSLCSRCSKAVPIAARKKTVRRVEARPAVCGSCGANEQLVNDACSKCGRWVSDAIISNPSPQKLLVVEQNQDSSMGKKKSPAWIAAGVIGAMVLALIVLDSWNLDAFKHGEGDGSWSSMTTESNQKAADSGADDTASGLDSNEEEFGNDWGVEDEDFHAPNYLVSGSTRPEDVISGALQYYCTSAPYQPSMWTAYGNSGIFSALNVKTGIGFYVKLSPGSVLHTTVLTANDANAQNEFKKWGCPDQMVIDVQ